ncbi:hypothetical protein [Undibacterium sp. Di24W]|uniref:hypothetical protein n=1 Tax=Undibacterium sp. Di24W TaxID=3413033 RepID=UPI003BF3A41C
MKIIAEQAWSHVLMDNGTDWILTYLIGGVVEIDVSIRLSKEEIAKIRDNPNYLEILLDAVKTNQVAYASRELHPPVWPQPE